MPERDLLPKNEVKVPFTILSIIIREGDGEEEEESIYSLYCHNVSLSL